jgi:glycerophosphoryl diester phosphodiesterase
LAPENTLAAARKAFTLGADLWECDVRFTKDGVPILMHDATLRRTTDCYRKFPTRAPWWVHLFSLAEVERLDAGSWFNQDDPFGQIRAGAIPHAEQQSYIAEPVPTLEEALRFTAERSWRMNIEIKGTAQLGPETLARRVVELVQDLEMQGFGAHLLL